MLFCLDNHSIDVNVDEYTGGGVQLKVTYPDRDSPTGKKATTVHVPHIEALAMALVIEKTANKK